MNRWYDYFINKARSFFYKNLCIDLYKIQANKWVTSPQHIFVKINKFKSSSIGLYRNETNKPAQKLLHSGHKRGLLMYGILATKFLTGIKISAKLHI
jgi:hypothetical protein